MAGSAAVAVLTVRRFETGTGIKVASVTALRGALEAAGIIFISGGETAGGGEGVRLQPRFLPAEIGWSTTR